MKDCTGSFETESETAKWPEEVQVAPVSYFDSVMGSFAFRCACGRTFRGPWEEARWESVAHVETNHASATIRRDLGVLEDTIEALIIPSPLNSWDQLQEGN